MIVRYPYAGDMVYSPGSPIKLSAMRNWMTADVEVEATPERVAKVTSGAWTRRPASVRLVPDTGVDPVLLLSGILTGVRSDSNRIRYTISHFAVSGRWTPRIRMTRQWLNHMPEPGTRFVWQDEIYILESR